LTLAALVVLVEAPHALLVSDAGAEDGVAAPGKYFGASTCDGASCHSKPEARKEPPYLMEYTSWSAVQDNGIPYDRHSYAFKRLKPKERGGDDKSASIMAKLNEIEKTTDTAETSERCLTCHGVSVHDYGVGHKNPGAAVGKHKELQGGKYRAEDGVSCDGCHGPAEKWLKKHDKKNWTISEWTKLGGKAGGSQKLYDEYGIYYSKDPELWANQCVRCHLRIDTNMLDAGHPDLNPFELFGQSQQVPHWRDYTTATPGPELPGAGPMHPATIWATGQTAALRSALEQVEARAKAKPDQLAAAVDRARAHFAVLKHALEKIAPDAVKPLDEGMAKLDSASAATLLAQVGPLVRKAADYTPDIAYVKALMKAIAEDPAIFSGGRVADQAMKAFYALNYARLTQEKPEALQANPPDDPIMKAVYANFNSPDPKSDGFKKAIEDIKAALK
jgi:hypothetical protein